jgi:hypothetical protein
VERRAATHLPRLSGVVREHEDRVMVRGVFSPVARPRLGSPRPGAAPEHVPAHHGRPDVVEPPLDDWRAGVHLTAFLALHLAERLELKQHSLSSIPPIPNGFSALCSGPAVKPSSDIIMFSLSLLIRRTSLSVVGLSTSGARFRPWPQTILK